MSDGAARFDPDAASHILSQFKTADEAADFIMKMEQENPELAQKYIQLINGGSVPGQ